MLSPIVCRKAKKGRTSPRRPRYAKCFFVELTIGREVTPVMISVDVSK